MPNRRKKIVFDISQPEVVNELGYIKIKPSVTLSCKVTPISAYLVSSVQMPGDSYN